MLKFIKIEISQKTLSKVSYIYNKFLQLLYTYNLIHYYSTILL